MHRAVRAIIMAAGIGSRMQPLTLSVPKPLITVNGIRMIDSSISALHQNGITEIYVVVGHLKEQFLELETKYPGLKLIENPHYKTCNNISSLYVAREHIGNSILLDGDQIIYNPEILSPLFVRSGYSAIWTEKETDEWLMQVEDGIVKSCSRTGGKHGWQLYSVSFWSQEDGERLRKHLEIEFEQKLNRQIYWDDLPLFCYPGEYQLGIRQIKSTDILEIDKLGDLIAIDSSYSNCIDGWEDQSI